MRNHESYIGFSENKRIWPFVSRQQGLFYYFQGTRVIFTHQRKRSETIFKETIKFINGRQGINVLTLNHHHPPHPLRQGPQSSKWWRMHEGKSHRVGGQIAISFGDCTHSLVCETSMIRIMFFGSTAKFRKHKITPRTAYLYSKKASLFSYSEHLIPPCLEVPVLSLR